MYLSDIRIITRFSLKADGRIYVVVSACCCSVPISNDHEHTVSHVYVAVFQLRVPSISLRIVQYMFMQIVLLCSKYTQHLFQTRRQFKSCKLLFNFIFQLFQSFRRSGQMRVMLVNTKCQDHSSAELGVSTERPFVRFELFLNLARVYCILPTTCSAKSA